MAMIMLVVMTIMPIMTINILLIIITITTIIMVIMITGNSVEQVVPGPDFTAGVKNVTVPEGRLVVLLYQYMHMYIYVPEGRMALCTIARVLFWRFSRWSRVTLIL